MDAQTGVRVSVLAIAGGISALAVGLAGPAAANPANDPCQLAINFLCQLVPVAPDLDDSIDLTQQPGTIAGEPVPQMPAAPVSDYGPPAPICADGCI